MVAKTKVPVGGIENEYKQVKVCFNCGYYHEDFADVCNNCKANFADQNNNKYLLTRVLEMETAIARRRERITCDEEERLKYGYNITTHFRFASQKQESAIVVQGADGKPLLQLNYGATADIYQINRGLNKKKHEERGFKLNVKTGVWGDSRNDEGVELHSEVNLMVKNTSNVLIVKPLWIDVNVTDDTYEPFIATWQYALKTAIQAVYKLEADELECDRTGGKYLLFWEAAEGGAGVLSQIIEKTDAFVKIANAALDICHFHQPKQTCIQACYECLLSYRNQFDHALINRHLILPWLKELQKSCVIYQNNQTSREQQYQNLLQQTDPNSEYERIVLKEIYERGYKLPDAAQVFIPEANCKPDFINQENNIAIFCDGSVHDNPEKRQQDKIERDNLKYNSNYHVLTLCHDQDWQGKLEYLGSVVKK